MNENRGPSAVSLVVQLAIRILAGIVGKVVSFAMTALAGTVAVFLFLPLLVLVALPGMFFGFGSSDNAEITGMTEQAMTVGGLYYGLEEVEAAQVDAIVAGIVEGYEDDGVEINGVKVHSSFAGDDLCWLIAIHSVDCRQDVNAMSAETIRALCAARLRVAHTLSELPADDEEETSAELIVTVTHLSPSELMDELGFDDESRMWAIALYETLSGSGALEKYASYFEPYRPSGPSGSGGQHGPGYGNDIDISRFVSPDTKNNRDLAAYAVQAWENNWGYVWGTYGSVLTETLLDNKIQQYPDGVGRYAGFIRSHWLNRRVTDCVGLIKGYGWLDASAGVIRYGTNGMPDCGANTMYRAAVNAGVSGRDYGPIGTMPEIVGLAVRMNGHIGVYIGGGYVVEAAGTSSGVVRTRLEGRGWTEWCKIPYIEYLE